MVLSSGFHPSADRFSLQGSVGFHTRPMPYALFGGYLSPLSFAPSMTNLSANNSKTAHPNLRFPYSNPVQIIIFKPVQALGLNLSHSLPFVIKGYSPVVHVLC